jgi:5-methylthioadenosine/S-adenosylhomocysteine deaminase
MIRVVGAILVLALFASLAALVDARQPRASLSLRGTVVTPTEVMASAIVEIENGRIKTVGSGGGGNAVDVGGVIVPGFVDLHNHFTWNVLPRWTPTARYGNRYEWQEEAAYALNLSGPHYALTAAGLGCAMNRYAEIKALVNGATAGVGGLSNRAENTCIVGLLRNLDLASDLPGGALNAERLRNVVFPFESDAATEEAIRAVDPAAPDGSGKLRAVVMHAAEGVDAASRREFRMLQVHGYLRPGVSISHGLALTAAQFKELADKKVGLIWSPRSNIELYGRTSDVASAKNAGVTIAIAPDWSPTGSAGMLAEIATAWKLNVGQLGNVFTDAEMFRMATSNPAALAGLSGRIGSVAPGAMADLVVLRAKDRSAYQSVVRSNAADVRLVVIGGQPLYGDAALMAQLLPGVTLESITVCGEAKALDVSGGVADQSFDGVSRKLRAALASLGSSLAPLAECQ